MQSKIPDILVKIKEKNFTRERFDIRILIATTIDGRLVPFQKIIAKLGNDTKKIDINETGNEIVDLTFFNIRTLTRLKLLLSIEGNSNKVTEIEVTDDNLLKKVKTQHLKRIKQVENSHSKELRDIQNKNSGEIRVLQESNQQEVEKINNQCIEKIEELELKIQVLEA